MSVALACELPQGPQAHEPPERRGLARDEVRLLVARRERRTLQHARFRDLGDFLAPGDLLVVNASRTLPAALPATRTDGGGVTLHLSTPLPGGPEQRWVVELRGDGGPFRGASAGETLELPEGARADLLAPYLSSSRLWAADLRLHGPLLDYLANHGSPIRYGHVARQLPLSDYQTVYGREPGSAEMPSAGRPFTPELLTALMAAGVAVAPLVLHTGVSSLERSERPYPERFRVPEATARLVRATRDGGGRVIAVGTTAVRALETVAGPDGTVRAGEGWTSLVLGPARGLRAVDGLLTGWHEPDGSHLRMLEALADPDLLARSYAAARNGGYLWHEFGDLNLILP